MPSQNFLKARNPHVLVDTILRKTLQGFGFRAPSFLSFFVTQKFDLKFLLSNVTLN